MSEHEEPGSSGVARGESLWHGRFAGSSAASLAAFSHSIGFDQRLWRDDLVGSRAHVAMLGATGILDPGDVAAVDAALVQVHDEMEGGV